MRVETEHDEALSILKTSVQSATDAKLLPFEKVNWPSPGECLLYALLQQENKNTELEKYGIYLKQTYPNYNLDYARIELEDMLKSNTTQPLPTATNTPTK